MKKIIFIYLIISINILLAQTNDTLIQTGSLWSYLDNGTDQGNAWQAIGFDDSGWSSGYAKLGYGDSDNTTTLSYGPDANNKYITYYFRHTFIIDSLGENDLFYGSVLYDDGAVIYVNGEEVNREGMPSGNINYLTLGTGDVGGAMETTFTTFTIQSDVFVEGTNVVAVEIHQGEPNSSDIGFDFRLVKINSEHALSVTPLIPNNWMNYRWPYNAYYPTDVDGPNGHLGNGCGPTCLSRMMHYYEYPITGSGQKSFTSYFGDLYEANFEETIYEWGKMPYEVDINADEEDYYPTANLIYQSEVAFHYMAYTNGFDTVPVNLVKHFLYKEPVLINRWEHTREEWIDIFKNELNNGRPILIAGRTEDSPAPWEQGSFNGHYFICDGYNIAGEFHICYGYGNFDGYYDIDNMAEHKAYHIAMIGFEPNFYGDTLSLIYPNGNEIFANDSGVVVQWQANDSVKKIKIEYSLNNGFDWQVIVDSTDAAIGEYLWSVPDTTSFNVLVRISNSRRINTYDKSDSTFILGSSTGISKHVENNNKFYVYPNPCKNYFKIHSQSKKLAISVYNAMGAIVFSKKLNENAGIVHIDISNYPQGLYFLQATDENSTVYLHKIIKGTSKHYFAK